MTDVFSAIMYIVAMTLATEVVCSLAERVSPRKEPWIKTNN